MNSIYNDEYRAMIARLIKMRKDCHLLQKDVAKSLNKPQSYISKIETCQRQLDILELKRFLIVYGRKSSEVFLD